MKEIFYEESSRIQNEKSASRKYNIFKTLSIISYVCVVLWILIFVFPFDFGQGNLILNLLFLIIPPALFVFSGIVIGKMKNRFYVDYDYTFVTGSLRIAKVIKNIKRKPVMKFDVTNIERIGKYGSKTYNKYSLMPGVVKMILTSNVTPTEGKDFYYIVVNLDGIKKLLILECTEMLMVNILRFTNRGIIEEDFK